MCKQTRSTSDPRLGFRRALCCETAGRGRYHLPQGNIDEPIADVVERSVPQMGTFCGTMNAARLVDVTFLGQKTLPRLRGKKPLRGLASTKI